MCWGELFSELILEVLPICKLRTAFVLQEFFPLENTSHPFCRWSGLHIGHSPYYFRLLVMELSGAEVDVDLTGVKKGQTFFYDLCQTLARSWVLVIGFSWTMCPEQQTVK